MADARFHSPQTSHQRRVAILMHHCMRTMVNCQNRVYRYVVLHTSRISSSCVGWVRRVGTVPLSVAAEGSACGATLTVTLSECCVDVRRGTNLSHHRLFFQVFFSCRRSGRVGRFNARQDVPLSRSSYVAMHRWGGGIAWGCSSTAKWVGGEVGMW